jgi:alpha-ketoglutarate-dependent taurine dioxygenase
MKNDEALWEVLKQLRQYGLVFIKNVPGENGPAAMGKRVGRLRDTFYGATWDVKSVPQAKNIAYTHQFLGFHMDLLYMADPPGFQMLHCIHNSCKGGESMFTDSFKAVTEMETEDRDRMSHITHFHYKNAGEHYRHGHRTVVYERKSEEDSKEETDLKKYIKYVSYSPPFQAPFAISSGIGNKRSLKTFRLFHRSLTKFQAITEKEENIFEYKMKEGEMVIFNNRRVLHARKAFETGEGERWLKGGYIDTDVVLSKLRVLNAKFTNPKEYAEIMGWAKAPIEELEESSEENVLTGLEESSEEKPLEGLKESSEEKPSEGLKESS